MEDLLRLKGTTLLWASRYRLVALLVRLIALLVAVTYRVGRNATHAL